MKKILVPTDFSACAANAINYAVELALVYKAQVILYHSIMPVYSGDTSTYAINFMEEYYDFKNQELKKLVEKVYKQNALYRKVGIKTMSNMGFTADNIVLTAKAIKADLIVMGTKGASGFQELVVGSSTGAVVARSPVPVLVIPAGIKYAHLKSPFVFATDYITTPNRLSRKLLETLCQAQSLELLNVVENKIQAPNEKTTTKFSKKLDNIKLNSAVVIDSDVNSGITKYTKKVKAGMLILVSHHYNLFERIVYKSVSKQASLHTKLPLLILVKE